MDIKQFRIQVVKKIFRERLQTGRVYFFLQKKI